MLKSLRLALILTPLTATPALAAEGGLLSVNTGLMVWTVLIFGLVLAVLYWKVYPVILGAVEAREERIRELLASAERDREQAQGLLAEQQREREALRAQVQELVAEGRTAGERLREEILAQARREQAELMERTRRDLERQVEQATAELREQTVELAIAAASKLVERNLDQADNQRLVREFLQQVESPANPVVAAGV